MLTAMRSPMRRSAAADSSELSPSEGSGPLPPPRAEPAVWASASGAAGRPSANANASRRLIERMAQDPEQLRGYLNLMFIARHLERVGDHAVNIAQSAERLAQAWEWWYPQGDSNP